MEMKKLSLANIQGKLSRSEMKNIMAGSGPGKVKCCAANGSYCTVCEDPAPNKSCCCGYTMAPC
jgi:hypothetical protein